MIASIGTVWQFQLWGRRLLLLITCGYLFLTLMFAAFQRSLIYPASKSPPLSVAHFFEHDFNTADVQATTSDGLTLHGWHFKPVHGEQHEISKPPVIIFLHGNGGNRVHRIGDVEVLTSIGAEVLIFDYRGYGENDGSPTESGLRIDARAMWKFATSELKIDPQRIILFGESLGGAVAVGLAAETSAQGSPPRGLIVRSSFSSMTDAAAYHYPWLPIRLALLDRYESVSRISEVTCPILALHGDDDKIVPLSLGKRLFEAAPQRASDGVTKRFVVLPGAGHNNVLEVAGGELKASVTSFLSAVFPSH